MHKKIPKICTGCRVSEAKIYLYHSTEIAKARPQRRVADGHFCPEAVAHVLNSPCYVNESNNSENIFSYCELLHYTRILNALKSKHPLHY